ncbi:MAG: hypothetical protein P8J68_06805 [Arenicellaceae bacterium]|nr:hypothetical protein [Arenicellaceae bacterium]
MVSYLWELDKRVAQNRLYPFALGALGLLIFCYWSINPSNISPLVPDSSGYLDFQAFRGAGYPLFLDALRLFDPDLIGISYYQLGMLIISLCMLAYSVGCFSGSALAGAAIVIGAGLHPLYIRYCFTILSEPLFFASLNVFFAIQLRKHFDTKLYWGATGAILAWLILIKGASWAFVCVPISILIHQFLRTTGHRFVSLSRYIACILIGFAIISGGGLIYRYAHHQTIKAESFLGNQLIGKFSLTSIDPLQTSYPASARLWQQEFATTIQVKNEYFSDNWDYQFLFSLNYYDYLRFGKADHMLELSGSKLSRPEFQSRLATELLSLASKEYIKDVAVNFYALWTQGELQTPAFAKQYNDQLNIAAEFMPNTQSPYYLNESGQTAAYLIKPFLYFSFLLNIAYLLYGASCWLVNKVIPSQIMPIFVVALAIQSYFLLVALLQAGLVRYMIPMWPLLLISTLSGVTTLLEKYFSQAVDKN